MRQAGALGLTLLLAVGVRLLPPAEGAHHLAAGLALGVLLLGGYLAGWITAQVGLPRLSGYMVFGLVAGPQVTHLLERPLLDDLAPVDGFAVALIALTAGAELRFDWLRENLFRIVIVSLVLSVVGTLGLAGLLIVLQDQIPFLTARPMGDAVIIATVVAIAMVTTSPLVILAVTGESGAKGPLTDTLVGVSILMDLLVVIAMAVALGVARSALGSGGEGVGEVLGTVLLEIGGSALLGAALGGAAVAYVRLVGRELALVVSGMCIFISEVAMRLHLEPLLVAIVAGLVLVNFGGRRSARFVHAIERVGLPVYALFFALLGANLDLRLLWSLGLVGATLVVARGVVLWSTVRLGAAVARAPRPVVRWGWLGFVSQAGVTLGIAVTIGRAFPGWGGAVRDLLIGVTAVNTLAGPVLHRMALVRARELPNLAPELETDAAAEPGAA